MTTEPWHASFPPPKSIAPSIPKQDLLQWLHDPNKHPGKDYVIIDLRRNDFEGGTIKSSLNLPAQSLYPSLGTLYGVFGNAGVRHVIWFCGSSGGRGTRAANWFQDLLSEKNDTEIKSLVLEGGIKGWVAGGEEYWALMEGFERGVWSIS